MYRSVLACRRATISAVQRAHERFGHGGEVRSLGTLVRRQRLATALYQAVRRAVKDLLALPTSRSTIVAAKYTVTATWCLALTTQTYLLGLALGAALRLPGWTTAVAVEALARMMVTAVLAVLLVTALGLAASVGRGYLAAIGVMFLTVFLAQVIAVLGYGHLFPWSVPAIYSQIGGSDHPTVGPIGYSLVVAVAATSVTATVVWWHTADHTL